MGREAVYRPTEIEVNLAAIEHNIHAFQAHLPADVEIMAIVKANAYGHGAVPVAKHAIAAGATRIGVAVLDEALELRDAGITVPILVMGYTSEEGLPVARARGIACTLYSVEQVLRANKIFATQQVSEIENRTMPPLAVHLKVDTGMNRLGFTDVDALLAASKHIIESPHLHLEGLFTHFAKADEADTAASFAQMQRFTQFKDALSDQQIPIEVVHVNNSAGAIHYPQWGNTSVRLGIAMYGLYPSAYSQQASHTVLKLQPALALKSQIIHLKEVPAGSAISYGGTYVTTQPAIIATIPIGYADGYSRILSNRAEVLVRGARARVVGRICMDQLMIEVTHIPDVALGEEVVLIGKQGADEIPAELLAQWSDTINYEIVTTLGYRLHRKYLK